MPLNDSSMVAAARTRHPSLVIAGQEAFASVIGAPASGGPTVHLGSPRFLVATKRAQIAELRERWR